MKYKKRRFIPGECMHIYQRTVNGFNIFYDLEDFLVFYTIFSVISGLYDIRILQLCMMIDHVHTLISSKSLSEISAFVRHYSSLFVMEYNNDVGRHGQLFHKSFGSAPKKGSKKIRSAIVYIGNNPVEKKLCGSASEYRWNFLAYIDDRHPFSERKSINRCGFRLKKALKEVKRQVVSKSYLTYPFLRRVFDGLDHRDREYLTDFIIAEYYPFDNDALLSFYESKEDMFHAMRSTAGSDYDIREKYYAGYDTVYREMLAFMRSSADVVPVRRTIVLSDEEKMEIVGRMRPYIDASMSQFAKFMHLKINPKV